MLIFQEFRCKDHWDTVFKRFSAKYGPMFTVWMGNIPMVFISDLDIARETFKKNDFSGRPESYFGEFDQAI